MDAAKHPHAPPEPDARPVFESYHYPSSPATIAPFPPGHVQVQHTQHVHAPPDSKNSYTYEKTTVVEGSGSKQSKTGSGKLFGSISKVGSDLVAKGLVATNKAVDFVAGKLDETIQKHYGGSAVMNLFQTGNVVQLISKTTGRTLEILQAPNGQLVLDSNGPDDPQAFHTHFIVNREADNIVTLHNNYNYIAIVNGYTTIHRAAEQGHVTLHCRLRLHEPSDKYVSLESVQEKNNTVGVTVNGALKSALATRPGDKDAYFAIRLIYSPHGAPPTVNSKQKQ
ncbi:uncharacterized protein LOC129583515 [Paramacrobiotus metropolitanus]|uniref:uncharacterized protein LOC129583515 n=1 Tax=Paramacrobiotus metropolitanus TaxID=2943436 RepID=UPI002445B1B0|nr:uncharacterized protein LOC129583515 [Paramacrobiotus metropolitanus]